MRFKKTKGDLIFSFCVILLTSIIVLITLYPFIYVISMSISDPYRAARGEVYLFPKGFSWMAMQKVLKDKTLYTYFYNTIWYTVIGTLSGVLFTCVSAYPLSRKEFKYRNFMMKYITITMFFSGGLIPTYVVITKFLKLYGSRLAIILPALTSAWYIIVTRSFFLTLPSEIVESARIDGASEYRIFFQLILPVSKPILAVLSLYMSVSHWNSYMPAMLYLGKQELHPLSIYLRTVVIQSSLGTLDDSAGSITAQGLLSMLQVKYAVVTIATLPMLLFFPFLSKNLEKGLLIGAVKG